MNSRLTCSPPKPIPTRRSTEPRSHLFPSRIRDVDFTAIGDSHLQCGYAPANYGYAPSKSGYAPGYAPANYGYAPGYYVRGCGC